MLDRGIQEHCALSLQVFCKGKTILVQNFKKKTVKNVKAPTLHLEEKVKGHAC